VNFLELYRELAISPDLDIIGMKPATPVTAVEPSPGTYASRVPTWTQQKDRPVIPGLPGQRPPLGALVSKGIGAAAPGAPGAAMQRGLIDSINLKQGGVAGIPFVKQKVNFDSVRLLDFWSANQ
jgi:hypothetical protein